MTNLLEPKHNKSHATCSELLPEETSLSTTYTIQIERVGATCLAAITYTGYAQQKQQHAMIVLNKKYEELNNC